jgi:fermentation-respiration switch protein FrsA (DUF1100 family)
LLCIGRAAAIVYLLICIIVYFAQNWLLFPGAAAQGTPEAIVQPPAGCELLHLTAKTGEKITALYGTALLQDGTLDSDSEHQPTFIYFYGNGTAIAWSLREYNQFRRLGVNVLMPDYAGYGMSSGKPSEKSLYATADAAYDYLRNRGEPPERIIAVGWSLGGAVAIDLVWRRPVAALAVFNAYTSIPDMAAKVLPWLPARLLTSYHFDNLKKIPAIKCPTFICNGLLDDLVPPKMSDQLAAAAGGRVTRVKIPQAGHNDIFSADPRGVAEGLGSFIPGVKSSDIN